MDYSHYERIKTDRRGRILTLTLNRKTDRRGRILTLTLNRPETAMPSISMHDELATIFYDVQRDDQTDVIVITGAGSAFSAGGDINWLAALRQADSSSHLVAVDAKKIVFGLLGLEKPIIARIPGPCLGLGTTIALFCDMIYCCVP